MNELLHYFLIGLIPMMIALVMVVVIIFWAWLATKIANGNYILALVIILAPLIIFSTIVFGYQIAHHT